MTTFLTGEQTHQAVLPQQPALESASADTPGSRDETAHGLPATVPGAGVEHGRGETGGVRTGTRRRHARSAASAAETAETGSGDAPRPTASRVFVLAKEGEPLMPCHPARARELLAGGRAVVARRAPFTIRLKHRTRAGSAVEGVQLRLDPGSKATGIAITDEHHRIGREGRTTIARRGLVTLELRHRGQQIHGGMMRRAAYRRRRRSANLRYRAPRHDNRPRPEGWLPLPCAIASTRPWPWSRDCADMHRCVKSTWSRRHSTRPHSPESCNPTRRKTSSRRTVHSRSVSSFGPSGRGPARTAMPRGCLSISITSAHGAVADRTGYRTSSSLVFPAIRRRERHPSRSSSPTSRPGWNA